MATTMRDIAKNLNFEVANVYNYIGSKQALLEFYLFEIQDEFHNAMDDILNSSYGPKEKLRLVISSYIRISARRPYEQALLVNDWRNLKERKLKEFVDRRREYEDKLKSILKAGSDQEELKPIDVDFATDTILATLRGLYKKHIGAATKSNPITIEKQLTEFIFDGISKRQ